MCGSEGWQGRREMDLFMPHTGGDEYLGDPWSLSSTGKKGVFWELMIACQPCSLIWSLTQTSGVLPPLSGVLLAKQLCNKADQWFLHLFRKADVVLRSWQSSQHGTSHHWVKPCQAVMPGQSCTLHILCARQCSVNIKGVRCNLPPLTRPLGSRLWVPQLGTRLYLWCYVRMTGDLK